ncbi:hypothetical protein KVT40_008232 [Elsinoe batatas]|uniref:Uncharacterized protein n=1 Tax=Elsinoe batatas TaxID=2601811 RepID=A0A8K0KWH1_9PEZI|nr:hypothetical protein KVT40_008232 [Elsinoe batatas]
MAEALSCSVNAISPSTSLAVKPATWPSATEHEQSPELCINCHSIAKEHAISSISQHQEDPTCHRLHRANNICWNCRSCYVDCEFYNTDATRLINVARNSRAYIYVLRRNGVHENDSQMLQVKQEVRKTHDELQGHHSTTIRKPPPANHNKDGPEQSTSQGGEGREETLSVKLYRLENAIEWLREELDGLKDKHSER